MSPDTILVECPICRSRSRPQRGLGRTHLTCANGHRFEVEFPERMPRLLRRRGLMSAVIVVILLALVFAVMHFHRGVSFLRVG